MAFSDSSRPVSAAWVEKVEHMESANLTYSAISRLSLRHRSETFLFPKADSLDLQSPLCHGFRALGLEGLDENRANPARRNGPGRGSRWGFASLSRTSHSGRSGSPLLGGGGEVAFAPSGGEGQKAPSPHPPPQGSAVG